jgi:hypothetical protein
MHTYMHAHVHQWYKTHYTVILKKREIHVQPWMTWSSIMQKESRLNSMNLDLPERRYFTNDDHTQAIHEATILLSHALVQHSWYCSVRVSTTLYVCTWLDIHVYMWYIHCTCNMISYVLRYHHMHTLVWDKYVKKAWITYMHFDSEQLSINHYLHYAETLTHTTKYIIYALTCMIVYTIRAMFSTVHLVLPLFS